jgi:hypothetical protein
MHIIRTCYLHGNWLHELPSAVASAYFYFAFAFSPILHVSHLHLNILKGMLSLVLLTNYSDLLKNIPLWNGREIAHWLWPWNEHCHWQPMDPSRYKINIAYFINSLSSILWPWMVCRLSFSEVTRPFCLYSLMQLHFVIICFSVMLVAVCALDIQLFLPYSHIYSCAISRAPKYIENVLIFLFPLRIFSNCKHDNAALYFI